MGWCIVNGGKHWGTWVQNHLEVWALLGSPALEHKCVCYTPGWCVTRGVPAVVLGGLIPWITHSISVLCTQCPCIHPGTPRISVLVCRHVDLSPHNIIYTVYAIV